MEEGSSNFLVQIKLNEAIIMGFSILIILTEASCKMIQVTLIKVAPKFI